MHPEHLVHSFKAGSLTAGIYESRLRLSQAAAKDVSARMKDLLAKQETIRMVFAPAASATDFLEALTTEKGIDWRRVCGFHLDEYVGEGKQKLAQTAKQLLFEKVPFGQVHYMNPGGSPESECARYTSLLQEQPLDIACIGIGENGHLAYNEPHDTDFNDPRWVKSTAIDEISRNQAVKDQTFPSLDEVPELALTITIPAICSAAFIYAVVPDLRKNAAVRRALEGPIDSTCPASILRGHDQACLYLDKDSSNLLNLE